MFQESPDGAGSRPHRARVRERTPSAGNDDEQNVLLSSEDSDSSDTLDYYNDRSNQRRGTQGHPLHVSNAASAMMSC